MWDNPVPDDGHCFNFKIRALVECNGYVFAESEEEAIEMIKHRKWDEVDIESNTLDDIDIIKIEEE